MIQNELYKILELEDEEYPENLRKIQSPPKKLYCLGNIELLKSPCAAVVGSRKFSDYGKWVAQNIGKKLSQNGVTVVSGMARGIDTFAHRGALMADGNTIAVLGCGIDKCFPAENYKIKDEIANKGLVISEYPPGTEAARWTFPKRNRIIAALSEIVVVAEAGLNSGAMITAELAAEQGKSIYAVPGNINNAYNIGNNKLIAEGAGVIVTLDDVVEAMGILPLTFNEYSNLGDEEQKVLAVIIERGEVSAETISQVLNKKISWVNGIITVLEMKGMVKTSLGKVFFSRK